jgi:hypothetical protein
MIFGSAERLKARTIIGLAHQKAQNEHKMAMKNRTIFNNFRDQSARFHLSRSHCQLRE